jgi:hypothetical protein
VKRQTHEIGVRQDGFGDALPSKGLLPEALLDVIEDLAVDRIRIIQDILECKICGTKTVAEMLRKDPAGVWNRKGKK